MNIQEIVIQGMAALFLGTVFFVLGYFLRKTYAERLIRTAESKAREILTQAKRESEQTLRRAEKESHQFLANVQRDFENRMAQEKRDLQNREKVLDHKESLVGQKVESAEKKEKEAMYKFQEASAKEKTLVDREKSLEKLIADERAVLQKVSNLNVEEAREQFLRKLEVDLRAESSRLIRDIEKETEETAEAKAKKILSLAIQRCAAEHSMESTTTVVTLPNEEMKGRIIGKDGRNIRCFETLTGVDVVIDDTPQTVVLSAFDGVRREVARLALDELIKDSRIHPARIEEIIQKTKRNMENVLKEEGEKAVLDVGLTNVHPEVVKLLGRLKYRSSYGQNVLAHSLEVAYLMNVIAGEMGLDPVLARRAGLLHDLGKAVSHDTEGPHALIGGELARRYGEHPDVVHGIEAHHEDIEMKSVWPMLVQAADAVSAARPGARRESLENYVKRLSDLEAIADEHPGVEKSFAIQGGREIRVMVKPDRVSEEVLPALAREISKKIEANLKFPGQIKVVLIRETRVEEVAK
jgi:ribonuclease Y